MLLLPLAITHQRVVSMSPCPLMLQHCYTVSANFHCSSDDAYRCQPTANEVCTEEEMQLVTDLDSTCCDGGPAAALLEHRCLVSGEMFPHGVMCWNVAAV